MRHLFSPWRGTYIAQGAVKGCFLCRAARGKEDVENLVLFRGKRIFIVMNRFPYNNGHLLLAPCRHIARLESLSEAEGGELFALLQQSLRILKQELRPDGFNTGLNLGRVAGARVSGHVHVHVVPRWLGDTNFMPVAGETRVISEALAATYHRLRPRFKARIP